MSTNLPQEVLNELIKLNENHALVMIGGKATIIEELTEKDDDGVVTRYKRLDYSEAEWKKLMANYIVSVIDTSRTTTNGTPIPKVVDYKIAQEWLQWKDRKSYKEYVFDPSWVQADKPNTIAYNTWRGFAKKPINHSHQSDNVKAYWNLVLEIICNDNIEELTYIQNWCSLIFQKPEHLTGVALVLRGGEGIGKNSFVDPLGWLLGGNGGNYEVTVDMERMLGNFNSSLMNKILVYANEATWGGNKQKEGSFKALVTDPDRTIEMKGKETFNVVNYTKLIIASNNEWCVSAGMDQRRLAFFNVNASRKGDSKYWDHIYSFLKTSEFLEALLFDLQNRDISNFNARRDRPVSCIESGQDVQQRSLDNEMKFFYEWLSTNQLEKYSNSLKIVGCKEVYSNEIYNDYRQFAELHSYKHIQTNTTFCQQLFGIKNKKGWLPSIEKVRKNIGPNKVTCHLIPNIHECRKYFEDNFCNGIKQNWLDDDIVIEHKSTDILKFENVKLSIIKQRAE